MTTAQHRLSGSGRWPGGFSPQRHRSLTLVLVALVAAAVAAGIIVAVSGGTKPASPARTGVALAPVTKGARWVTGPASQLIKNVNRDQGKFNAAHQAGQRAAAQAAGAQLASDAKTALNGPPPPADAALYRSALTAFERAGADAAAGDFGSAGTMLAAANGTMTRVTAAMNPAAPANGPAQVTEPNG